MTSSLLRSLRDPTRTTGNWYDVLQNLNFLSLLFEYSSIPPPSEILHELFQILVEKTLILGVRQIQKRGQVPTFLELCDSVSIVKGTDSDTRHTTLIPPPTLIPPARFYDK